MSVVGALWPLTLLAVLVLLHFAQPVLVPMLLAILLAELLAPLVRRFERHLSTFLAVTLALVAAMIGAKPEERRQVLEEAAGISGLRARRHEAELKLRQAETNLTRAEDLLNGLDAQRGSLQKQARQANRYRNLSGLVRGAEAEWLALLRARAGAALAEAREALGAAQAGTKRAEAEAAGKLAGRRVGDYDALAENDGRPARRNAATRRHLRRLRAAQGVGPVGGCGSGRRRPRSGERRGRLLRPSMSSQPACSRSGGGGARRRR